MGSVFTQGIYFTREVFMRSVLSFIPHLVSFFTSTKFIFFFFFEKLNKQLYKYAKYKKPRYSIKYLYVPPYKRFRNLLNFFKRSSIYFSETTFKTRLFRLLFLFFTSKDQLFFYKYTLKLQAYVFKKKLLVLK